MSLLPPNAILPLLRCPRCRQPLTGRPDALSCTAPACAFAGRTFPSAGGQQVLVDFERSVLVETEVVGQLGESPIARPRQRGVTALLRRLASPHSRLAGSHMRRLRADLAAYGTRPRVLVVGGGTRTPGSEPFYEEEGVDVIAFDIYASPNTQFIADAHAIPLADGSVDAVSIQAVLEHVLDPWQVVAEINRVLAPSGLVYSVTPFLQHVHEGPWDFTRFTESGHRWLFRNFERIDSGVVAGPATVWVWATEQLVRGLTRSKAAGKLARIGFAWVHALDRAIPEGHAVDGASCLYFYGRKCPAPILPRDTVAHYRGAQRP